MKIIAENKKAAYDYQILEKFEAGIVLSGQEVKSLRTRGTSLAGSYVALREGELFWLGTKIYPYQPKNTAKDYNPERARKLLLRKSEIKSLIGKSGEKGLTLVPLKLYTKKAKIKLEFGVARGRKKLDKRELIRKRETQREIERALKM